VDTLAEHAQSDHNDARFLGRLADRGIFRAFAGQRLPRGKLPRKRALGDRPPDQEHAATGGDHRGGYDGVHENGGSSE
jgi:hypothetical protein